MVGCLLAFLKADSQTTLSNPVEARRVRFVHNHPSGDPKPARDDIEKTREVKAAAEALGIPIHDHLVIGRIAIQSVVAGHSPRIGMAKSAVIAGARAANAEPLDAPSMLTARPIHTNEITATRRP